MTSDQHWDPHLYEAKHAFVWQQGASLLDLLAVQPGEHILDLGCGTGQLTARIAEQGATVLGLDHSPAMIAQARANYPHLQFLVGDARQLEFKEEFDAVFSNAVLHWITEPAMVLTAVAHALRPGGRIVAEFGGKGNVAAIVEAMQQAIGAITGIYVASPWYFPSADEYAALLETHELEVNLAMLFDRPTVLEGEAGLRHWIEMFGGHYLERVPEESREEFFRQIESRVHARLWKGDHWIADYRRLRIKARKSVDR